LGAVRAPGKQASDLVQHASPVKSPGAAMDLVGRRRKPTNENNMLRVVDAPSGKDAAAVTAAAQKNMKESFFRSLPRACFGFLLAVLFDQFLMLGYAAILLSSGSNTSAYYFAACILLFAFALGYFSLSAARTASPNLPTPAVAADAWPSPEPGAGALRKHGRAAHGDRGRQ